MRFDDMTLTPLGLIYRGRRYPCSIGRRGISTHKREGDGATPAGIHRVVMTLYRPDRIAPPAPWAEPILPGDLWSDAPEDAAYNTHVRAPYAQSHEALRRADPLYDLILVTDWNWPVATPGKGSCIFIHQWRRPGFPTEGCLALKRRDLYRLAREITPGTRFVVPNSI
ncbi:L,D-transpeptidase family protein [Roseovarius nanhaiticus]|uniref:L,D-transpeptidase family protein n=1 Tax=Roseovarius nanhaiticus TaxID=573024 RepID=UPI0024927A76|nr:L,D-transpeptidase family protein [Roseovarius nanhaiticus]